MIELAFTPCGGPSSPGSSVGSTQPDDYAERPTVAIGPPEMILVHVIDDAVAVAALSAQAADAEVEAAGERLLGILRVRGGMGAGASALTDESPDDDDDAERPSATKGPPSEMIRVLSRLDDRLAEALRDGDIKLLRVSWLRRLRRLLRQPNARRLKRRQELEALILATGT